MTHAQIAANARAPYAAAILERERTIAELRAALEFIRDAGYVFRGNGRPHVVDSIIERAESALAK